MKATVRDGSMSLPQWRATTLTQMSLDEVDKMIGRFTDLIIMLTLDHHTQERFGPGIAYQHAAAPVETLFTFVDRALEFGDCVEIRLLRHLHIEYNLRHRRPSFGQVGQGLRRAPHQRPHL